MATKSGSTSPFEQRWLRAVLQSIGDAVITTDKKGKVRDMNPVAERLTGWSESEARNQALSKVFRIINEETRKKSRNPVTRVLREGRVVGLANHTLLVARDGAETPIADSGAPIQDEDGTIVGVVLVFRDQTAERQAAQALQEAKEFAESIVATIREPLLVLDADLRVVSANRSFYKTFQVTAEETEGERVYDLGNGQWNIPRLRQLLENILPQNTSFDDFEVQHDFERIGPRVMVLNARRIYREANKARLILLAIEDVTERRRAEEEKARLEVQVRRSQKLETIGTLAGGIAHDFNNILTPIMGYAEMALSTLAATDPLREDLQHILRGAGRAKELVRQILLFSRQVEKERQSLRLDLVLKEAIKLLRPSIPTTIEIRQRIDRRCPPVFADPSQIHQVMVNLCTNAYQAMEATGGTLSVELKPVRIDHDLAATHPDLSEGEYVCFAVSDTGPGIDAATLERIFEPFFTTKPVDKGTGMGLAVVHGIVRSHRGAILVESAPGKGSTFRVYLPVMRSGEVSTYEAPDAPRGGGEHILLVDDDQAVVSTLKRMLESLDYRVTACGSAQAALKAFRKQPQRYHLMITDLTMPGLTGLVLSQRVRQTRADLPIIVMTGYGETLPQQVLQHYAIRQVLAKPIETRELARAVRNALKAKF